MNKGIPWFIDKNPVNGGHDLYFNPDDREERVKYLDELEKNGTITWNQKLGYLPYRMSKVKDVVKKRSKAVKNPFEKEIKKYFMEHKDVAQRAMRNAKLWDKAVKLVRRELAGKRPKNSRNLIDALEFIILQNPPRMFPQIEESPSEPPSSPLPLPPTPSPPPPPAVISVAPVKPQRKRISPVVVIEQEPGPQPQPKPQPRRKVTDANGEEALAELIAKRTRRSKAIDKFVESKGPAPEQGDSYRYFMEWLDKAIPDQPPQLPQRRRKAIPHQPAQRRRRSSKAIPYRPLKLLQLLQHPRRRRK